MTPLETHLALTLPLVAGVVGGIWLWGKLERYIDESMYPKTGEEPFPGAWPFTDQAGADEPAKLRIGERSSVSP